MTAMPPPSLDPPSDTQKTLPDRSDGIHAHKRALLAGFHE
uniref:Uncharacterized protein n=1 Tax=Anguilla anguilla TaxID=7936 RepID=A0A0E9Q5U6_ANGAN